MGAIEAENESYVTDEGKFVPLLERSNLFNQFILFLGQVINLSSYIRHFNVLMCLVGVKEREEFMLKVNATLFTERDIMLLKIKFEKLVAKSLNPKNKSKALFASIKNTRIIQVGKEKVAPLKRPTIQNQRK